MRVLNALFLASALSLPLAAPALAEEAGPTITVTGEGSVEVRPDMATVTLGVTTEGATAAEAMAANSAELTKVLANLRAAGIEERDIQTSGLSLNPNWDNQYSSEGGAPKIAGFIASNTVTVTVRALDGLGQALDAAVKDGANTLNGVTFGVSEPDPALDEARKKAVADARRRAETLAEAAGARLGEVRAITEGGGYAMPAPMYRMEAAAAGAPVPVAPGEMTMAASVTIVWDIAD